MKLYITAQFIKQTKAQTMSCKHIACHSPHLATQTEQKSIHMVNMKTDKNRDMHKRTHDCTKKRIRRNHIYSDIRKESHRA